MRAQYGHGFFQGPMAIPRPLSVDIYYIQWSGLKCVAHNRFHAGHWPSTAVVWATFWARPIAKSPSHEHDHLWARSRPYCRHYPNLNMTKSSTSHILNWFRFYRPRRCQALLTSDARNWKHNTQSGNQLGCNWLKCIRYSHNFLHPPTNPAGCT